MPTISPVGGASSWCEADLHADPDWVYELDGRIVEGLLHEVEHLLPTHRDLGAAATASCPSPTRPAPGERELFESVRHQLIDGRGLALMRGLPVEGLDIDENEVLSLRIGQRLGVPIHQNARGDHVVHVRDDGKDFARRDVRSYETAAALNYHSDSSDVVGLLCLRPALSGGTSTIVSATRVHDEMVLGEPDLAALLYEPWWRYNPTDDTVALRPVFVRRGDELFTHYGRHYIELAAADGRSPELTERQIAALDHFDELCHRPDLVMDMGFQPGDLQLLNNFRTLHSRTGYTDHPDPARRRHLCRIWLVMADDLSPPEEFADVGFVPRTVARTAN